MLRKMFFVVAIVCLSVSLQAAVVTSGLALELNAAYSGNQPGSYWQPTTGSGTGELVGLPELKVDVNAGDGTENWYYQFDSAGAVNDQVLNIGTHSELSFVDDDWCTIEAWVRLPGSIPNLKTRGIIIGNTNGADTGWRLDLRCDANTGKYAVEFQQRDNETAVTSLTGSFHYHSGYVLDYSDSEWAHVVFVKYAAQYNDTTGNIEINHDIYVNGGSRLTHGVRTLAATGLDDFYFAPYDPKISNSPNDMYYVGDLAVVRIYDRLLNQSEVQANYDAGFAVPEPTTIALLLLGGLTTLRKRK